MNVDKNFWRNPDKWPRDDPGHVFLARAVHEIGKHLFDGKWTGQEPTIQRPDMAHFKEWQYARARFEKVIEQIALWIRTDKLILGLRRVRGGEILSPYPAKLWENKQWKFRFYRCMVNPNSHDDNSVGGPHHQYIYVTRESLNKCLKIGSKIKPGRKPGGYSYPQDGTIVSQLADLLRNPSRSEGLTGNMICDVAEKARVVVKSGRERERLIGRIRARFKKEHPILYKSRRRKKPD
jgi:hypothetical protein